MTSRSPGSRPAASRAALAVSVTDGRGRAVPGGRALAVWLTAHAPRSARGTVTIALIGDAAMKRLNRDFLGKDRPTDVLSFPAGDEDGTLGDLAIATGVAARQAREHGHALATEYRILALHGLLHLLGYDHEADRGRMRQVEERLRRQAGLPSGLIARATGRQTR